MGGGGGRIDIDRDGSKHTYTTPRDLYNQLAMAGENKHGKKEQKAHS
jgi:hypothetical protein